MSNRNSLRWAVRHGLLAGAVATIGAVPAQGQDSGAAVEEIIVTGSRIARSDFTSESPVSVVTSETLLESGIGDLGEALRTQIAVTTGGFGKSSNLSGGGAQAIDLRNLGSDRVLTLINGRRFSRFADSLQNESYDLSLIPIAMIERVEILRDGASAIYGADAVSGVVNVILKDDFEGVSLTGGSGITGEGDADEYFVQGVMGSNFDEGNMTLSAEYRFRDNVPQRDRDWGLPTISFLSPTALSTGSGAHPGGTFFFDGGNAWCTQPKAFGGDEVTNVFGTAQCPGTAPVDPDQLIGRYDYGLVQDIINQEKQVNLAALARRDFSDFATGFLEVIYSRRDTESQLDGNPLFAGSGSPSFPNGWVVPASNPYNPFPGESALVQIRPTSTVGPRSNSFDAHLLRTVVGLRGDDVLGRLDWELSYTNSRVTGHSETNSTFNLRRAITISDPDLCAADPLCAAALAPDSLGALDVYRPGNWAESEIAYFRQGATTDSEFDLENVQAVLSGELFDLPAGGFGVAVGAEWREESASFTPDGVTSSGESVANQTFATDGSYDVTEFFAEVNIPLLSDVFLARELTLNLQGRYFDYSTFGDDTVYKAGLNYSPVQSLRFRATFGTSFRAPTLVDSFSGGTVSFDFITDPCNSWDTSGNPTLIANCGPGGANLPPGFEQSAAQLPVLAGGDLADGVLNLGPEEAESWTAGVVFQPEFLPGLQMSVDYWDIRVESFIDRIDIQTEVLEPCYNSPGLSDPSCSLFSRSPSTGNAVGLISTPFNRTGEVKTNGVDWAIAYTGWEMGPGELSLDHQGTFVTDFFQPGVTVGPGEVDFGDPFGVPELRMNFAATYDTSAFSLGLRARMIDGMDAINSFADGNNPIGYDEVDEYWEVDTFVQWRITNALAATVGVNNLLDEEPPYVFSTGTNTYVGLYGSAVTGQYWYMRLVADF